MVRGKMNKEKKKRNEVWGKWWRASKLWLSVASWKDFAEQSGRFYTQCHLPTWPCFLIGSLLWKLLLCVLWRVVILRRVFKGHEQTDQTDDRECLSSTREMLMLHISLLHFLCCFVRFSFLDIPGCRVNYMYSVTNKALLLQIRQANCICIQPSHCKMCC